MNERSPPDPTCSSQGFKAFSHTGCCFHFAEFSQLETLRGRHGGGTQRKASSSVENGRKSYRIRKHAASWGSAREHLAPLVGWARKPGAGCLSDSPAPQILGHRCPAAEQIGSEGLEALPQPHHRRQRLGVEVQHGVLLLDVDQRLFVHVLQKLFGLLGHLQNKFGQSVLAGS